MKDTTTNSEVLVYAAIQDQYHILFINIQICKCVYMYTLYYVYIYTDNGMASMLTPGSSRLREQEARDVPGGLPRYLLVKPGTSTGCLKAKC